MVTKALRRVFIDGLLFLVMQTIEENARKYSQKPRKLWNFHPEKRLPLGYLHPSVFFHFRKGTIMTMSLRKRLCPFPPGGKRLLPALGRGRLGGVLTRRRNRIGIIGAEPVWSAA
jgi:hypothetical protein